jgi:hypothetical protein
MNNFLMMDAYAACGYLTLGVDYFLGVCYSRRHCRGVINPVRHRIL